MATIPHDPSWPEDDTPIDGVETQADEAELEPEPDVSSPHPGLDFNLKGADMRERALPIRQGDLNRLLLAEPGIMPEDREKLSSVGRILGATFHSEFYDKLRELKELYAPLDPDSDYVTLKEHTRDRTDHSDEDFLVPFEEALERANFSELDIRVIEEAVSAPNEMGLTYRPDFSLFEHLKVYARGYTRLTRDCRTLATRFRKRTIRLDAYQRLVVALKFKDGINLGPFARSDVFYLRMFKDVPHVDMEMHLPEQGTKVRMRWIDRAQIASPLMMGLGTGALKLLAITMSPWALGGLIVAPISAGINSFFGFQRAKQRHLSEMIHRLYYLSLANNACVLNRLIDSAEDEEYKETALAFFFLWRATSEAKAPSVPELDERIEQYLLEKTGVAINFEVADALTKLFRLGLVHRDSRGGLHAVSLDQALRTLDRQWDDTFKYA